MVACGCTNYLGKEFGTSPARDQPRTRVERGRSEVMGAHRLHSSAIDVYCQFGQKLSSNPRRDGIGDEISGGSFTYQAVAQQQTLRTLPTLPTLRRCNGALERNLPHVNPGTDAYSACVGRFMAEYDDVHELRGRACIKKCIMEKHRMTNVEDSHNCLSLITVIPDLSFNAKIIKDAHDVCYTY
eukprot:IDg21328t1